MKKRIVLILASVVFLSFLFSVYYNTNMKSDEELIKDTIEKYYDLSYDIYSNLEWKDLSSVLNEKTRFGRNYVILLKKIIEKYRYGLEKNYTTFSRERLPVDLSFEKIKVQGNTAEVTLMVQGDVMEAYPFFICFDENIVHLEKGDGGWRITTIYSTDPIFEALPEIDYPDLDIEKLHRELDEENGVFKDGKGSK